MPLPIPLAVSSRTNSIQSAELGGAGVSRAHSLQQAPQERALCRLGTAEAVFRRGWRGLQIVTVGSGKVCSIILIRGGDHFILVKELSEDTTWVRLHDPV